MRFFTPPATASAITLYVASFACLLLAVLAAALAASFVYCPAHVGQPQQDRRSSVTHPSGPLVNGSVRRRALQVSCAALGTGDQLVRYLELGRLGVLPLFMKRPSLAGSCRTVFSRKGTSEYMISGLRRTSVASCGREDVMLP